MQFLQRVCADMAAISLVLEFLYDFRWIICTLTWALGWRYCKTGFDDEAAESKMASGCDGASIGKGWTCVTFLFEYQPNRQTKHAQKHLLNAVSQRTLPQCARWSQATIMDVTIEGSLGAEELSPVLANRRFHQACILLKPNMNNETRRNCNNQETTCRKRVRNRRNMKNPHCYQLNESYARLTCHLEHTSDQEHLASCWELLYKASPGGSLIDVRWEWRWTYPAGAFKRKVEGRLVLSMASLASLYLAFWRALNRKPIPTRPA